MFTYEMQKWNTLSLVVLLYAHSIGLKASEYSVQDLGAMGGLQSYAHGINASGEVVGYCLPFEGSEIGFLFSKGRMSQLFLGQAHGINASGQIVGEELWLDANNPGGAIVYFKGVKMTIGHNRANAINDNGQVVGSDSGAFLYAEGQKTYLGTLGGTSSEARGINNSGQIVGYAYISNNQRHAFNYQYGTMKDLGTLGGDYSDAFGVNDRGQIIGYSQTSRGYHHAFLYFNDTMVDLDPNPHRQSKARGINNSGQVVGMMGGRAFLYSEGRMLDLNDLVSENSPVKLLTASAINDAGQIVGIGQSDHGGYHAFLLTPKPPSGIETFTFTVVAGAGESPGAVDGRGAAARFSYPSGVAVDEAGNILVADRENNTLRKISPAGDVTTLAGCAGQAGAQDGKGGYARFHSPNGVAVDGLGCLYAADSLNHLIRKIDPHGAVTVLAGDAGIPGSSDGAGREAQFYGPFGVAVDRTGNVFVTDENNNTIRMISPTGLVTTLAGQSRGGTSNGIGNLAQFNSPKGIAIDTMGQIYVADFGNSAIRKISPGGEVTTLAGLPGSSGAEDGFGIVARFQSPEGLALDANGNIWVADTGNHTIRNINSKGEVTTLAGLAGKAGSADGSGESARFTYPSGIAVDPQGNLYVTDSGNHTIRKINANGQVTTLAGFPTGPGNDDVTASAARFKSPSGLAVDSLGNTIVADTLNRTIRRIDPAGVVTTLAGVAGEPGISDGTGNTARFGAPAGLALDHAGTLYVADWGNNAIRKISPDGDVTTWAGKSREHGSMDGPGSEARFYFPSGIAVDSLDNVYVADTWNQTIRKINPQGDVSTLAGLSNQAGNDDGLGSVARFNFPVGLAADSADNLFVADFQNHIIRKIDPQGNVSTFAGLGGVAGNADGTGTAACFLYPAGLAMDRSNNLYVADSGNHTLRKITPQGQVTTLAKCVNSAHPFQESVSSRDWPWYPDLLSLVRKKRLFPLAVAIDAGGNFIIADNLSHTVLRSVPICTNLPWIDMAVGAIAVQRQLDVDAQGVNSWNWSIVRRPSGSTADLSSTTIRNPTFIPDVADLYVFRLSATNQAGAVCVRDLPLNAIDSSMIVLELHPELNAQLFTVSFPTVSGIRYSLEFKDTLADPNWTSLTSVTGNGVVNTFTEPAAVVRQRYYRIRVQSW